MPYKLCAAAIAVLAILSGCAGLRPASLEPENVYMLEGRFEQVREIRRIPLTLLVSPPRAMPGYDTARMAYMRHPFTLEYFSNSRWADTPAKMLGAQLIRAMEQRSGFTAVAAASGIVKGDLRLDTEIVALRQDFTLVPSRVSIELRAQLLDTTGYRPIATRVFRKTEAVPSDDAYGGVVAANRALSIMLAEIAEFVSGNTPQ